MAKKSKGPVPSSAGLEAAMSTLARGDYVAARAQLAEKAQDPELSEGEREQARSLIKSTWVEHGAMWVALACLSFFGLVVAVTFLRQP